VRFAFPLFQHKNLLRVSVWFNVPLIPLVSCFFRCFSWFQPTPPVFEFPVEMTTCFFLGQPPSFFFLFYVQTELFFLFPPMFRDFFLDPRSDFHIAIFFSPFVKGFFGFLFRTVDPSVTSVSKGLGVSLFPSLETHGSFSP